MTRSLTAILTREDDGFVALCPEVDVASQGNSVEDAKRNLQEAVKSFFECASPQEVEERLSFESSGDADDEPLAPAAMRQAILDFFHDEADAPLV